MKTKNILFVTFHDVHDSSFGGAQCTQRNYMILSKLASVEVYYILKKSTSRSIKSGIERNFPPVSNVDKKKLSDFIKNNAIDYVFFDHSLMGSLVKYIKKECNVKLVTFFHNVEVDYIDVRFGNNPKKIPYKLLAKINETMSITYSDKTIALSKRDTNRINELYGRNTDMVVPITFENRIDKNLLEKKYNENITPNTKTCLFVGAFSISNYEGIKWFSDNVAPKINATIVIVGKGFEKKKDDFKNSNIEVVGFVENLEEYYIGADCVISPLLSGGGMKVKIAEALMYGKTIFGTKESFEGYELDYNQVGGLCNSTDEFILMINNYLMNSNKYNQYSRYVFENLYSDDKAYQKFQKVFTENEVVI